MHTLFSAPTQDLGIPDRPIIFVQLGPNFHEPGSECWYDIREHDLFRKVVQNALIRSAVFVMMTSFSWMGLVNFSPEHKERQTSPRLRLL
jgi:hypothetical protein